MGEAGFMGLKVCSLSSGSSGNATYIGTDRANILSPPVYN